MRPATLNVVLLLVDCGPSPPSTTTEATTVELTSGTTSEAPTSSATSSSTTGILPLDFGGSEEAAPCGYTLLPVDGVKTTRVVASDFNADGVLDLALEAVNDQIELRFGDGSGTGYTLGGKYDLPVGARFTSGDFNGDGRRDLILYGQFLDKLRVLPNIGGDFGIPVDTPMNGYFSTFRVADVDGDGDDDTSEGGYHGAPVRVWHAQGGEFVEAAQLPPQACYATAGDWADFDGDGDLDFAVVGDCNGPLVNLDIAVFLRDGSGYVSIPDAAQVEALDPFALEAGDFDGDGARDLVTQGYEQGPSGLPQPVFQFQRGFGDGSFAMQADIPVGSGAKVVRAFDVDADGFDDILANGDLVMLHRGTADGFKTCAVGPGSLLDVGDFNGDAVVDLLLADKNGALLARGG